MADLHYERISIIENNDPMVDVEDYPFLSAPAYYAQGLAESPKLYTRMAVAEKLLELQTGTLVGYRFKIFDPWRSRAVQQKIYQKFWTELLAREPGWDHEKLKREVAVYVADPERKDRVPSHSTGGSIDLTLADAGTGHELDMGTGFDHFGIEANPDYFESAGHNNLVRDNRRLLRKAMLGIGLTQDPDEWWHFDYGNQKWAEAAGEDKAIYGEIDDINASQFRKMLVANLKRDSG
jgi:D-alanyl-D-alanine dipeptidase